MLGASKLLSWYLDANYHVILMSPSICDPVKHRLPTHPPTCCMGGTLDHRARAAGLLRKGHGDDQDYQINMSIINHDQMISFHYHHMNSSYCACIYHIHIYIYFFLYNPSFHDHIGGIVRNMTGTCHTSIPFQKSTKLKRTFASQRLTVAPTLVMEAPPRKKWNGRPSDKKKLIHVARILLELDRLFFHVRKSQTKGQRSQLWEQEGGANVLLPKRALSNEVGTSLQARLLQDACSFGLSCTALDQRTAKCHGTSKQIFSKWGLGNIIPLPMWNSMLLALSTQQHLVWFRKPKAKGVKAITEEEFECANRSWNTGVMLVLFVNENDWVHSLFETLVARRKTPKHFTGLSRAWIACGFPCPKQ